MEDKLSNRRLEEWRDSGVSGGTAVCQAQSRRWCRLYCLHTRSLQKARRQFSKPPMSSCVSCQDPLTKAGGSIVAYIYFLSHFPAVNTKVSDIYIFFFLRGEKESLKERIIRSGKTKQPTDRRRKSKTVKVAKKHGGRKRGAKITNKL